MHKQHRSYLYCRTYTVWLSFFIFYFLCPLSSFAVVQQDAEEEVQQKPHTPQTTSQTAYQGKTPQHQPAWQPLGEPIVLSVTPEQKLFWKGQTPLKLFSTTPLAGSEKPKTFHLSHNQHFSFANVCDPKMRFQLMQHTLAAAWEKRDNWEPFLDTQNMASQSTFDILQNMHAEYIVPFPTFPRRKADTKWFDTDDVTMKGLTLTPVEKIPPAAFIRLYDKPFVINCQCEYCPSVGRRFYLLEIFFRGMTCLGCDEVKSSGGLYFPTQDKPYGKQQRIMTHKGLVQHTGAFFNAAFGAFVSEDGDTYFLEGAEGGDEDYTFLQGASKQNNHNFVVTGGVDGINTLPPDLPCPLMFACGIRASDEHNGLKQEPALEALAQNIPREAKKAGQEVERAARTVKTETGRAAREVGRFFRKL